jgi:hypothetical protein
MVAKRKSCHSQSDAYGKSLKDSLSLRLNQVKDSSTTIRLIELKIAMHICAEPDYAFYLNPLTAPAIRLMTNNTRKM